MEYNNDRIGLAIRKFRIYEKCAPSIQNTYVYGKGMHGKWIGGIMEMNGSGE